MRLCDQSKYCCWGNENGFRNRKRLAGVSVKIKLFVAPSFNDVADGALWSCLWCLVQNFILNINIYIIRQLFFYQASATLFVWEIGIKNHLLVYTYNVFILKKLIPPSSVIISDGFGDVFWKPQNVINLIKQFIVIF